MNEHKQDVIGIDVSKSTLDFALLRNNKLKHKVFKNTPAGHQAALNWLQKNKIKEAHICLESTNIYGDAIATLLYDAGYSVSIVNPAPVKGFSQSELLRTKTDKSDAGLIARFCLAMNPSLWTPDPQETRELKGLVRRLEALMEMRHQEANRLEVAPEIVVNDVKAHITYLDNEIKETRQRIRNHINNNPDLKQKKTLLESIPGIGEATIAVVLSEFSDVSQFKNAKCLAAYIGVAPKERLSGSSVRGRTMMSKTGRSQLRKAFFMPALVALRYNPILIEMKLRLTNFGKAKMAIVGAAMRKLVHLIYGVLKSGLPFDANYVTKNS